MFTFVYRCKSSGTNKFCTQDFYTNTLLFQISCTNHQWIVWLTIFFSLKWVQKCHCMTITKFVLLNSDKNPCQQLHQQISCLTACRILSDTKFKKNTCCCWKCYWLTAKYMTFHIMLFSYNYDVSYYAVILNFQDSFKKHDVASVNILILV